ncbi:class I SAM-dependent methyltransferase [candidate division KSB1 bacterium]|nr:class I SAM-dependent methyltransferase [candidate division KSB1 bacterium]
MNRPDFYFKGTRPEIVRFLPEHYTKILEIGCGEGDFSANFKSDYEYWGIEPNQGAAQVASRKLKVLIGTFQEVCQQLPDDYFDLIICNDVIEHMDDYNAFFQAIKAKMTDSSFIVGSIPNVRYISHLIELLLAKDWRYREEGILDESHLRFFTEKSFRRAILNNGFRIERLAGINGIKLKLTPPKRLVQNLLIPIFGADSRYMQFGFRIKYVVEV